MSGIKNGIDIYLKTEDNQLINLHNLIDIKIWKNTGLNTTLIFSDITPMNISSNFQSVYDFIKSKSAIIYNPLISEIRELLKRSEFDRALELFKNLPDITQYNYRAEYLYIKLINHLNITPEDFFIFSSNYLKRNQLQNFVPDYKKIVSLYLSGTSQNVETLRNILNSFAFTPETRMKMASTYWNDFSGFLYASVDQGFIFTDNNKKEADYFKKYEGQTRYIYTTPENGVFLDLYYDILFDNTISIYYQEQQYYGIWTQFSEKEVLEKLNNSGSSKYYTLQNIDIVIPKGWKCKRSFTGYSTQGSKPKYIEEDRRSMLKVKKLSSLRTIKELQVVDYQYTGRVHTIQNTIFYEMHIITGNENGTTRNILTDAISEICKACENQLRISKGLPEIGKGWFSENLMYNIIKQQFPDAIMHHTFSWLSPQHVDVYIPSIRTAFEYQGVQHYKPVDFFGGEEKFKRQQFLDNLKKSKCKINEITLIVWDYDEEITSELLSKKLS